MNWGAIFNVVTSALAAGLAGFTLAKQTNATDETAMASAGTAALTSIVQHFRSPPVTTAAPGPK